MTLLRTTPTDLPDLLAALPRPIGLALSGGAALGAMQVGMARALFEAGLRPDFLCGTSVGAINGAWLAGGWSAQRIETLGRVWSGLRFQDVFGSVAAGAVARALTADGTLARPTALRALLRKWLPRTHAELALPFTAVASDLATGEAVELREGDLRRNVQASAAIPRVFPSVTIDGRRLVDGAIAAQVPLVPAARQGARTIVALDVAYPCLGGSAPRGAIPELLHILRLMLQHQTLTVLPLLEQDTVVLYVPSPCPMDVRVHDFGRAAQLVRTGYEAARGFLAHLRVDGPGVYGHPVWEARVAAGAVVPPPLVAGLRGLLPGLLAAAPGAPAAPSLVVPS